MSSDHFLWSSTESTLSPRILQFRLSNSGFSRAMYPSSVVHTGVKSFGWENNTHQESPAHSWKRMGPSVVCAPKSGALLPIRSAMAALLHSHETCSLLPGELEDRPIPRLS